LQQLGARRPPRSRDHATGKRQGLAALLDLAHARKEERSERDRGADDGCADQRRAHPDGCGDWSGLVVAGGEVDEPVVTDADHPPVDLCDHRLFASALRSSFYG
jgi:hypothetical protein